MEIADQIVKLFLVCKEKEESNHPLSVKCGGAALQTARLFNNIIKPAI